MESFCWREIGISGDRSCVELTTLIHCRNCSAYTRTARQVFDRPLPERDKSVNRPSQFAFTDLPLSDRSSDRSSDRFGSQFSDRFSDIEDGRNLDDEMGRNAIAIFRLEQEWFALPATMFHSIVSWRQVRPIPHRSNELLQGLVNVRGELLLCVSLAQFLKMPKALPSGVQRRLAIIEWEKHRWAFPVDEFQGIETLAPSTLLTPPATVLKASQTYTHSLLPWHDRASHHSIDRTINCLDETLLFDALTRKAIP